MVKVGYRRMVIYTYTEDYREVGRMAKNYRKCRGLFRITKNYR